MFLSTTSGMKTILILSTTYGINSSQFLAALSREAINLIFSCLIQKPNKPKKAEDLKLQYNTTENSGDFQRSGILPRHGADVVDFAELVEPGLLAC